MKAKQFFLVLSPYLLAAVLIFGIEILSQRSLNAALSFAANRPLFFLLNVSIVALTLAPGLLLRHRLFYNVLISGIWIAFGITDFILQSMRVTPFEGPDLYIITTGFSIIDHYLKPYQIVLICVLVGFFFAVLGALYVKSRKCARHPVQGLLSIAISAALTFCLLFSLKASGLLERKFGNLVDAYHKYGFVYCFCNSVFDRGIDRPDDYSEETIRNYANRVGLNESPTVPDEPPNIVFVQLESFFDIRRIRGLSFSENPIPNFSALSDAYPSGLLSVPSVGAGTANTEFEMLTGMDLACFGSAEYPYKTLLLDGTCESVPYLLSGIGYSTHAIHNNTATFYARNTCYANLGFDSFTSLEYMDGLTYNALDWAEDKILTGEILSSLKATEGKDYVFAVSVQGHGGYPNKVIDPTQTIRVTGGLGDSEQIAAYEYYINQIYRMDQFVGELVAALSEYGEKTVVVFYGDHQPGLNIASESLSSGTLYETEYVVWANYDLPGEDKNLESYQLTAKVLGSIGISCGNILRTHQALLGTEEYERVLEAFQYDLISGKRYLYPNGESPYRTTDMSMGTLPITVTDIIAEEDGVRITGTNFTEYSQIMIITELREDGSIKRYNELPTVLLEDGSLFAAGYRPDAGKLIAVGQFGVKDNVLLSHTAPKTYQP